MATKMVKLKRESLEIELKVITVETKLMAPGVIQKIQIHGLTQNSKPLATSLIAYKPYNHL